MRVLIGCEFSGVVRDAFASRGHEAWSCDLLPSATPGNHFQCDVRDVLGLGWDLAIFHPPCTDIAVSGARHFRRKGERVFEGLRLPLELLQCDIPRFALENPVSLISSYIRKPDQIIQPWQFGHGEMKTTCLWLKGLPKLTPTKIVDGREQKMWRLPPSENRAAIRSTTNQGIADAMAEQWG